MAATLFFALAGLYLAGVVGIVVVDSFVGSRDEAPAGLDERLALAREPEATPKKHAAVTTATALPYFVRRVRRR